jgi:voltage-gated potassium channel
VNDTPSGRGDDPTTNAQRQRIAAAGRKVREAPRPNLVERRMSKFLREPPSIRMAASVIVTATALVLVGGGVLIRVLDHSEYPNIWVGMWWATQTVTTVGYGDVTPKHVSGRIVGVFVMLEGISFLAIITAVITSSFVARAANERSLAEGADDAALEARLDARFDDVSVRFDRIESILREQEK